MELLFAIASFIVTLLQVEKLSLRTRLYIVVRMLYYSSFYSFVLKFDTVYYKKSNIIKRHEQGLF